MLYSRWQQWCGLCLPVYCSNLLLLVSVDGVLRLERAGVLLDDVENIHCQLHRVHLLHKPLDIRCVLADKRHQVLVGNYVLQILGIPRVVHIDLQKYSQNSQRTSYRRQDG